MTLPLLVAVLSGCGTSGATSHGAGATSSALGVGTTVYAPDRREQAPPLVGTTLDGTQLSVDDSVDRHVVVLNVWASWCGPCRDESPALAAQARILHGSDVRFFGIDEQDTTSAARAFVGATHSPYPHFVDKNGGLLRKLRILPQAGIPSTLVLDRHGRMAVRVIGPTTATAVQQIVHRLLAEP